MALIAADKPYVGNASAAPLFVYGTLMEDARQQALIGRVCAAIPATLKGYQWFQGEWPYIQPNAAKTVEGWLLLDLTLDDLALLDDYEVITPQLVEGRERTLYNRVWVQATDESGAAIECWVYLPRLAEWEPAWLAKEQR